jgi:acetoacetyl-CoA synthetase
VSAPRASRVDNFADRVLRNRAGRGDKTAVYSIWQGKVAERLTWDALVGNVADCRNSLLRLGVSPGDQVMAQMATGSAALTAFLATASVGAVWSTVALGEHVPDLLRDPDRPRPKVVLGVDGFIRHGLRVLHDIAGAVAACESSRTRVVLVPNLDPDANVPGAVEWGRLFAEPGVLDVAPVAATHGLCQELSLLGVPSDGELLTHGAAATSALHAVATAPDVCHDSIVALPAEVGSGDWMRIVGVLSLGVTIVLAEQDAGDLLDADGLAAAVPGLPGNLIALSRWSTSEAAQLGLEPPL